MKHINYTAVTIWLASSLVMAYQTTLQLDPESLIGLSSWAQVSTILFTMLKVCFSWPTPAWILTLICWMYVALLFAIYVNFNMGRKLQAGGSSND